MKIIVDTSVFIDFSRSRKGDYSKLVEGSAIGRYELVVPTIVIAEFYAGESMNVRSKIIQAGRLFLNISRVDLNENIAKLTGELIRKGLIYGFDAIVAATALTLGAELATGNKKHFAKVKGLRFFVG